MSIKHASLVLALLTPAAWGQKPVISAVVNAASYDTGVLTTVTDPTPTPYLTEGSIAFARQAAPHPGPGSRLGPGTRSCADRTGQARAGVEAAGHRKLRHTQCADRKSTR